jgi:hypothetical protein
VNGNPTVANSCTFEDPLNVNGEKGNSEKEKGKKNPAKGRSFKN